MTWEQVKSVEDASLFEVVKLDLVEVNIPYNDLVV